MPGQIPSTPVGTMTATPDPASTTELPDSAEPVRTKREAALSTLEQMGLDATMTQSAPGARTPVPADTPTVAATIALLIPVSGPTTEENIGDATTLQRPAAEAGWDAVALLIVSGGMLLFLYWSMKRNLKSRKFSKYR